MTKKKKIIVATLSLVMTVAIIGTVHLLNQKEPPPKESEMPIQSEVEIAPPKITEDATGTENSEIDTSGGNIIDVDDGTNSSGTKTPAEESDKPTSSTTPPKVNPADDEEKVEIGTNPPTEEKYSCGVMGHQCINAENHAHITNLELQGCEFCGSNSCKSFYYVSSAGIPMHNPELCPEYNSKQDPTKYCSDCSKPMGDGNNGTCEKLLVAGTCPVCEKHVEAHTCHSH